MTDVGVRSTLVCKLECPVMTGSVVVLMMLRAKAFEENG